jgi:hypothetical protein
MLIKLAVSGGKKEQKRVSMCCRDNKCIYIPIYGNKFGILTATETKIALGKEASDGKRDFNVKPFVDIYNCSKRHSMLPFWTSHNEPYASILLDNQYFINLIDYCIRNKLKINCVKLITSQGTSYLKDSIDEIKKEMSSEKPDKILELTLSYKDNKIIVKKSGYVILASGQGFDYYENNKEKVNEIISVGFLENYG